MLRALPHVENLKAKHHALKYMRYLPETEKSESEDSNTKKR